MHRVFTWIVDHPRFSAGLALLIPIAFSLGLPRLEVDASTRSLFPDDEPDVEYYRNVRANFGSDSLITVVAKSEDALNPAALRPLRDLAADLEKIEGVRSVLSFFNLKTPKKRPGVLRLEFLIEGIPETDREREALNEEIRSNPVAPGFLLNEDGTASALHVLLRTETGKPRPGSEERIVGEIDQLLREAEKRASASNLRFYMLGAPVIKTFASQYIWHDLAVLGPIALLVIGGVIFLFYRSALATFLPLVTGIFSVIATLGFMGIAGFVVNPFASTIVVLILVMGCTEDLHILAEYFLGLRNGMSKLDAIRQLGRAVGSALLLTSITTFLGFLSIAPNPISGLREFAIACGAGILLNFIITVLLVPAVLRFLPAPRERIRNSSSRLQDFGTTLAGKALTRPVAVACCSALIAAAAGIGVSRIEVDTSYIRFFPKDSEIGRSYAEFSRDFGGASSFTVTIETGREKGIYEPEIYAEIEKFHDHLDTRFDHTIGYVDFIRETREQFMAEREQLPRFLRSKAEEIQTYNFFLGRKLLSSFVDYDGSRTAIRVRSFIPGSKGMRRTEEEILAFARENLPPDLEVRVTGERVLTARFSDIVTRQLVENLIVLSGVVTLLLMAFFRSIRLGLIAIVPNLFPVLVTFGFMGWAGIPLSTGTFAVAIVALGIAVDDTIHFITRFVHESKRHEPIDRVLASTLSKEFQPVLTTSIALVLGFLVLFFSPFLIHRETGILFAIAITTALFADLFVTPVLLRVFGGVDPARLSRESGPLPD